jgi:hypothetical protein
MITTFILLNLLSSCELMVDVHSDPTVTPPEYQTKLDKITHFKNTYYLCEIKNSHERNVYIAEIQGYCAGMLNRMPAMNEYLQNRRQWSTWHKSLNTQYRLLGIVNSKDTYRLDKATIRYEEDLFEITVMSGSLAGIHATIYDIKK